MYCKKIIGGICILTCPTAAIDIRNDVTLVKEGLNSGKY